ncbi:CTP--2,3-di-O-geranylgeranyl-sn-glycero-1-phosphate cytidyltransferase [Candidatus Woesearchaeota archaeon]|nr:CTP--2,3-di-O-geranylgeranyl-sn-glycero-1-phosphate cytidyltransferase [Candidatus Woesearchaeota archaeon]
MLLSWTFLQELKRKALHVGIILLVILYTVLEISVSREIALFTLLFVLLVIMGFEYLRLELQVDMPLAEQFLRVKERQRLSGAIFFMASLIISLGVLDFRIALAAILMATFGDMAGALAGKGIGKARVFRNKTFSGSAAELLVNALIGFLTLNNIYIILAMALTATITEILVNELDDNLYVPLFTGFVGQLFFYLL